MKNLSKVIMLVALTPALLPSCKKPELFKNEVATTVVARSVKDVKAPSTFNWSTSNTVNFTFKGLAGDARKSTLTILSDDNTVLFKKLHNASENYTGLVEIPAHVSKLLVQYNGNVTEFPITSNKFVIDIK